MQTKPQSYGGRPKLIFCLVKHLFIRVTFAISENLKKCRLQNKVIKIGTDEICEIFKLFFKKWAIPGLFFLYFRLFCQ